MKTSRSALFIAALAISCKSISSTEIIENAPYYAAFMNGCGTAMQHNQYKPMTRILENAVINTVSNTIYQNTIIRLLATKQETNNPRSIKLALKKNMSDAFSIIKHYGVGFAFGLITKYVAQKTK